MLNNQWVLTAGHCTDRGKPEEFQVHLGHHDLVQDTTKILRIPVQKIVHHPKFDNSDILPLFDFSLLKLSTKVDFVLNPQVQPICLPLLTRKAGPVSAIVAGWGPLWIKETDSGGTLLKCPTKLMEATIKVFTNEQCKGFDSFHNHSVTPQMLCAGGTGDSDACQGDSGQ